MTQQPLWYQQAIIYQLHVKSFCDGNNDGIGDFIGLLSKLDYLQNLGVNTIWLLPFYPSPLKDDGYDIADYYSINPDYGTLHDFKLFLKEAHDRGLRVVTELVINHTSDQHPWYQRARKSPKGSVYRDYYVFSDTNTRNQDVRIIFKDFEDSNWTYDPVAQQYFWHRFYSHQPDLNFDSPRVQKEVLQVLHFWFEMGVDGLRLDAIPYLFEREGTNCENLPETHEFLRKLRKYVDTHFEDRMLLAEANQWPEDTHKYFGKSDECHMAFHFPVMPRMFISLHMEDRFPILDILEQTPSAPKGCQWALFLRNHDELTLEMVSEEERDYMNRVYAKDPKAKINLGIRRRLAPLVENDRKKIELLYILLFSLPGTPIIYYGDEIGMGDNYYLGDRNGVRTPMQWSSDKNAGFSKANPQQLFLPTIIDPLYHFENINVENQENDNSSLLWWMRRVLNVRKRHPVFGSGEYSPIASNNSKVLTFKRTLDSTVLLIVINMSRHPQMTQISLDEYSGYQPTEIFSQNEFPSITDSPYTLTVGPYGHYWLLFDLETEKKSQETQDTTPELSYKRSWNQELTQEFVRKLEKEVIGNYVLSQRWFRSKAKKVSKISVKENFLFKNYHMLILEASFENNESDLYFLPLSFSTQTSVSEDKIICELELMHQKGYLIDSLYDHEFQKDFLLSFRKKHHRPKPSIQLEFLKEKDVKIKPQQEVFPQSSHVDQSNASIVYKGEYFLKVYRKLEEGLNPDPEISRFLKHETSFSHTPAFLGSIHFKQKKKSYTLGMLSELVPSELDAWTLSQNALNRYFESALVEKIAPPSILPSPLDATFSSDLIPQELFRIIGPSFLESMTLLGQRTAELHKSLTGSSETPEFAPEKFSMFYQRSLYQTLRYLIKQNFRLLDIRTTQNYKEEALEILGYEQDLLDFIHRLIEKPIKASRQRIHGDFHLGQVLSTGKDFLIIDFEGEPLRSINERKLKKSPVHDIAGMIRSFHYAASVSLRKLNTFGQKDIEKLAPLAQTWAHYTSWYFCQGYLEHNQEVYSGDTFAYLLDVALLEKIVYEIGYELNNRPDWLPIPMQAMNTFWDHMQKKTLDVTI